jgi:mannose-6-phosphate isomerase-like protein (cupin superfamily)
VLLMQLIDTLRLLVKDVELYQDLLRASDSPINASFVLTDSGQSATLVMDDELSVQEGLVSPTFKLLLTSDLLARAMRKEVDLFALGGRSSLSEKKPVDFEFVDKSRVKESMEYIYRLATYFLLPGRVKSRQLTVDLAGSAHGAKPIPLVYWNDLRTAWYHIPKGAVLNEAGEKDPWPQTFITLKGAGRLIIEDAEIVLEPNTAYYIPRNALHQVHAVDDLELIWMAWDAPMFQ